MHTHTQRQIGKQTDRQNRKQTRQTNILLDKPTDRQMDRKIVSLLGKKAISFFKEKVRLRSLRRMKKESHVLQRFKKLKIAVRTGFVDVGLSFENQV